MSDCCVSFDELEHALIELASANSVIAESVSHLLDAMESQQRQLKLQLRMIEALAAAVMEFERGRTDDEHVSIAKFEVN